MNPEWLLRHFDQISEAPDTVPRLRRFILDLAVRGKLVEQDPNDEPASELLKRIDNEKAILINAEKIKAQNRLPMPHKDAINFKLPSGWKLVPLGEVAVCLDYRRVPINNEERAKRIEGKPLNELFPYYGATQQQGWIDDFIFDEELVLLGEDGVPFFETLRPKAYIISGKTWVNNHAHVFWGILTSNKFLVNWLNVLDYTGRVAGATRSKLNQSKAVDIPVPLPPLAEQHRIVAKVDELMVLCDELVAAQAKREKRRDRLVAATLHGLNNGLNNGDESTGPVALPTFEESARFYFNHLPRLTTRPEHIHQLRQAILNLAVRGKLVPQDPNDEPASKLIERIQRQKQSLRKAGEIRQQKVCPPIATEEIPFIVPVTWEWTRLSELAGEVTSGSRGWAEFYSSTGPKFIRAQNVRFGYLDLNAIAHVELPTSVEGKRTSVRKGNLLIVITGAGVTNPAMLEDDIGEAYVSQHVALVSLIERGTSCWLLNCLMAPSACRGELLESAYGAGKPGLNLDNIRMLKVPLPPLAEQHRIVKEVKALLTFCDELEIQLTTTATARNRFLKASIHQALYEQDGILREASYAR